MTFTGVPSTRVRVGSQIRAEDMTNTAADAEHIRTQLLTVDHHANQGNRLFHPIATAMFGATNLAPPLTIPTGTGEGKRLFSTLIYVPQRLVDAPLFVVINAKPTLNFRVNVSDDTLTELASPNGVLNLVQLRDSPEVFGLHGKDWAIGSFSVSTSGVYCLDVSVGFQEGNLLESEVYSFHVCPTPSPVTGPFTAPAALNLSAHTIRAHQTVDPATTAADGPMGQAVMMVNENMARLVEEATGLPVPGNSTRTATPHTHDGTTGIALDQCIASLTFGIRANGVTGVTLEATGNNSAAPATASTTLDTVAQFAVRTPVRTYTTASTTFPPASTDSKLRVAVLVENDTTKHATALCWVVIGDLAGAGGMLFKAPANGRQLVTSPDSTAPYQSSLNFTSGGYNPYFIQIRSSVAGASFCCSCHAVLLYLEE